MCYSLTEVYYPKIKVLKGTVLTVLRLVEVGRGPWFFKRYSSNVTTEL